MANNVLNSLGNFHVSDNGTLTVARKVGGEDPKEVGKKIEAAKSKLAQPIQDQIKISANRRLALSDLDATLKAMAQASKGLTSAHTNIIQESLFDKTSAKAINTATGLSPNAIGYAITGPVKPQSILIDEITQIAKQDSSRGSSALLLRDFALSPHSIGNKEISLGWAGNLVLGFEGYSNKTNIPITNNLTLQGIVDRINASGNFEAEASLEEGTQSSYKLLIRALSDDAGKILTIDSSALTGANENILPQARLKSVTEANITANNATLLKSAPPQTFDQATAQVNGLMDGVVTGIEVSGSGSYTVTMNVKNAFGTMSFSASNYTPQANSPLTLTNPVTNASFSIDCANSVANIANASGLRIALEQTLGVDVMNPTRFVSPSSGFANGLAEGSISSDGAMKPGTYSIRYDPQAAQMILSNGLNQWSQNVAASGAQEVNVNGVKILLDNSFDKDMDISEIKINLNATGANDLKDTKEIAAGWEGILKVGTAEGNMTSLAIKKEWPINKVIHFINTQTDQTGVMARIMGNHVEFLSKELSTPIKIDAIGLKGLKTGNILNVGEGDAAARKDALSTKYVINNQTITVADNKSEIIPGLLVEFIATSSQDNQIRIDVDKEVVNIAQGITDLIEKINDFFKHHEKLQTDPSSLTKLSEEEKEGYGILKNTAILRNIRREVFTTLTRNVSGLDDAYNNLSHIGIKFDGESGRFVINNKKLIDSIANHTDEVQRLFTVGYTLSDSDFRIVNVPKQEAVNAFTLSVNRSNAGVLAAQYHCQGKNYEAVLKEVGDNVYFIGSEDSPLQGVEISRPLNTIPLNAALTVEAKGSRGIADFLSQTISTLRDGEYSALKIETDRLEQAEARKEKQIEQIKEAAKKAGDQVAASLTKIQNMLLKLEEMQKHVEDMIKSMNGEG